MKQQPHQLKQPPKTKTDRKLPQVLTEGQVQQVVGAFLQGQPAILGCRLIQRPWSKAEPVS